MDTQQHDLFHEVEEYYRALVDERDRCEDRLIIVSAKIAELEIKFKIKPEGG